MPQACWPQSIPFTEAELNNNYCLQKKKKNGGGGGKGRGKGERQRRCLRALLGPRKPGCSCQGLLMLLGTALFFFSWILWFCLRKESKIERKNKVPLYKSAAAPCQIKGMTFLLLDFLSTWGLDRQLTAGPLHCMRESAYIFFRADDKLIRDLSIAQDAWVHLDLVQQLGYIIAKRRGPFWGPVNS